MNHGRFTDCCFLRSIGRELLTEFFQRFEADLTGRKLVLPAADASDDAFFTGVSRILLSPEGLPDRVNEVLHEIQELSTEAGHDRLKAAIGGNGLQLSLAMDATPEETALRVWLNSPELLVTQYSQYRFSRLKPFVYFEKDTECLPLQRISENQANESVLVTHLDAWFSDNGRGSETVLVEKFELNNEEWYLIRHGDTYLRSSRIEKRKVEVVHYRPAKDDLVVYCPERDELRINAKTKGERELYRAAFGQYLHGLETYFRETDTYCLEPLRELGVESLECNDIPGIKKVVLTQVELGFDEDEELSTTWKASDLFACKRGLGKKGFVLPVDASLKEAAFSIFVGESSRPMKVQIIPPATIRLENKSASHSVHDWLSARGFKRPTVQRLARS